MNSKRHKPSRIVELLPLVFAVLLVLLIALLTYHTWTVLGTSNEQVRITEEVVRTVNGLLSSLKDAETGQRGFLLTGEDRYLEPYRLAVADVPALLRKLSGITAGGRPDQARRAERLPPLVNDKLAELRETIALRVDRGPDAALAVVRTDRGKAVMDQIRAICGEIEAAANSRLTQFSNDARQSATQLGFVSTVGSASLFVLLISATGTIRRGIRRREELIDSLNASEAQARQSRDWLQTTLASIGDAVITTDGSGKVTLLNPVAENLTGWRQEEAAGRQLDTVFVIENEETHAAQENPVAKVLREGRIVGLANHTRLIARDGRQIPIDDSAAPIRDAQGNIAGVVLVFRDISSRREAESKVQRNVAALLRANEDLSHFAFAASHDLQEPLRMITSYSQLLIKGYRGELAGEAATCIQFITDGSKRMRALLGDLLAYTQLSADGQAPLRRVDLNAVVGKAAENCKAAIEETTAVLTWGPLPEVTGHDPHFVQLFQNLIENAIKYRGPEAPRIRIAAWQEDGMWRFTVSDNGMGIDPEYHQKIFGVFKRLHGRNIPGTGIGLAICQRVVERYGGRIWVESEADRGATFCFTLPVEQEGASHEG